MAEASPLWCRFANSAKEYLAEMRASAYRASRKAVIGSEKCAHLLRYRRRGGNQYCRFVQCQLCRSHVYYLSTMDPDFAVKQQVLEECLTRDKTIKLSAPRASRRGPRKVQNKRQTRLASASDVQVWNLEDLDEDTEEESEQQEAAAMSQPRVSKAQQKVNEMVIQAMNPLMMQQQEAMMAQMLLMQEQIRQSAVQERQESADQMVMISQSFQNQLNQAAVMLNAARGPDAADTSV